MTDTGDSKAAATARAAAEAAADSSDSPRAVFARLIDALNAHDLEGMLACIATDYHSVQPLHPAREFTGADQVRKNWSSMLTGLPDLRAEVLRTAVDGEAVWAEMHWAGTRTDGVAYDAMVVTIFGVRRGSIVWGRLYAEPIEREGAGIDAAMERTTGVRQS